jgi:hypothetical protein
MLLIVDYSQRDYGRLRSGYGRRILLDSIPDTTVGLASIRQAIAICEVLPDNQ